MEIWSQVIGYESFYLISNHGRVKAMPRKSRKKEFLNGKIDSDGYLIYTFYGADGKYKNMKAHRAVAIHFIKNPQSKPTVNHKDGDKLNNHVDNLEWATHLEQIQHAVKNGLRGSIKGIPKSPETIAKMSKARIGVSPWNKGKKGLQVVWNKGLKLKLK